MLYSRSSPWSLSHSFSSGFVGYRKVIGGPVCDVDHFSRFEHSTNLL